MLTALSLMMVPVLAGAQEPQATERDQKTSADLYLERLRLLNGGEDEKPYPTRYVPLRREPNARVREIYVAGGVSTIIRLPAKLHTRGTKVVGGGEHRFEVLLGDRKVIVTPTQALAKGERFPLVVTLADGEVIPLSLTGAPEGLRADGEVQLTREPEKPEELKVQLVAVTERALTIESRYLQALREQDSKDFALATLLAGGAANLTAFIRMKERRFVDGAGRDILLETYASRPDAPRAASQVAVVFGVTNRGAEPVEFTSGRAFSSPGLDPVPLAFRAQPRVIRPGENGSIAVVFDRTALKARDGGKVALDFFSKARGGQIEFSTDVMLGDFGAVEESGSWWPFGRRQR